MLAAPHVVDLPKAMSTLGWPLIFLAQLGGRRVIDHFDGEAAAFSAIGLKLCATPGRTRRD